MKLNKSISTSDYDSFCRRTLQSYKDNYFDILDYYKSLNIDNDEASFIDYEIRLIKEFIKPVLENNKTKTELECGIDFQIEFEVKPYISSYNKIISFLETKKLELETNLKPKHDNIFSNNGFELFEYILKKHIKPKGVTGRQSDLVYYHRKMYDNNPQYIHRKPTDFFKWFDTEYSETSGQLVTYERVKNPIREKDYSTALEWFRLQEKTV
jgi:hypothetical protein